MQGTPLFRALVEEGAGRGRPAGGTAEENARRLCASRLSESGFQLFERPFEYSAWPGLWATPVAGVLLVIGGLVAWLGTRAGQIDLPLAIGSAFLTVATVGGAFVGELGPLGLRRARRHSVNLEATRGAPTVWLVAHLDSKSQTIPMVLRIAAVLVCAAAWTIVLTLWMMTFVMHVPAALFAPFALVAAVSAIPLAFTFVGDRSAGALDNASGVATVLEAAARLDPALPIGVLITSAEELGLAGARAWVRGRPRGVAVNVDSVDDRGGWLCMVSGDATLLRDDIRAGAAASGLRVAIRGVIPGILVDAVAFKDAGWPAVTISRGGLYSLGRIHTSRDTLARTSGASIDIAATLVREIVGAIIARDRS